MHLQQRYESARKAGRFCTIPRTDSRLVEVAIENYETMRLFFTSQSRLHLLSEKVRIFDLCFVLVAFVSCNLWSSLCVKEGISTTDIVGRLLLLTQACRDDQCRNGRCRVSWKRWKQDHHMGKLVDPQSPSQGVFAQLSLNLHESLREWKNHGNIAGRYGTSVLPQPMN